MWALFGAALTAVAVRLLAVPVSLQGLSRLSIVHTCSWRIAPAFAGHWAVGLFAHSQGHFFGLSTLHTVTANLVHESVIFVSFGDYLI